MVDNITLSIPNRGRPSFVIKNAEIELASIETPKPYRSNANFVVNKSNVRNNNM